MIKSEIRSMVFNMLQKLDKEARYHPRFLDSVVEKCLNEMLWEMYALDSLSLQRYTVTYGRTALTVVPVSYEATTQLYYSTLPAKIIPFPDRASGVRRIHTVIQSGLRFLPMDFREMDLVRSSSYYKEVTDKILYAVDQTRVEYYGMTVAVAAAGVRMDIIQPFSQYADTDTVLIPEFRDQEGLSFDDRVKRKLSTVPPIDLSEDTDETIKTTK
jgi:hypothetical protein